MNLKEKAYQIASVNMKNKCSPAELEDFAEALIESYKAELLNEVQGGQPDLGEPVAWLCWLDGDTDLLLRDAALVRYEPLAYRNRRPLFTSNQLAAAILKATKPLEDQLAKAEQRAAEWQPIETAPKDGSVIVVGYGRQGNFPVKVVYWKELHKIWMHYGEWEPGLENNATHWMPLPKAPNSTSS